MGTVWEARHLALETLIAIKFLNSELSFRHDIRARFSREATSAARIRSPHVVGILDSGFTDEGHAFIAMELLRGEDLGRRLTRVGKLSLAHTASLLSQVSRGLAKAHDVGIVHRDLKPENLFTLDEDSGFSVKILDFGIAKAFGAEAATHKTDTGQLLGTPRYMSPEQALGRAVDHRSDLYSLAVVAYRCITGTLPFTYNAVGEQIVAVSTHQPPPPSQFDSTLPPSIDDWFAKALAKDPNARAWQHAQELAASFDRVCGEALNNQSPSRRPRSTTRPGRTIAPVSKDVTEAAPASPDEIATTIMAPELVLPGRAALAAQRARRFRARSPWLLVLVAALGAGATAAWQRTRAPETSTVQDASPVEAGPAEPVLDSRAAAQQPPAAPLGVDQPLAATATEPPLPESKTKPAAARTRAAAPLASGHEAAVAATATSSAREQSAPTTSTGGTTVLPIDREKPW
jgi:hypothetical protein